MANKFEHESKRMEENIEVLNFLSSQYDSLVKGRVVKIYKDLSTSNYQIIRIIIKTHENQNKQIVFFDHMCDSVPEINDDVYILERKNIKNLFIHI